MLVAIQKYVWVWTAPEMRVVLVTVGTERFCLDLWGRGCEVSVLMWQPAACVAVLRAASCMVSDRQLTWSSALCLGVLGPTCSAGTRP